MNGSTSEEYQTKGGREELAQEMVGVAGGTGRNYQLLTTLWGSWVFLAHYPGFGFLLLSSLVAPELLTRPEHDQQLLVLSCHDGKQPRDFAWILKQANMCLLVVF